MAKNLILQCSQSDCNGVVLYCGRVLVREILLNFE